jgi:DNA invertase Pin-like site-specific DNA recombinase
MLIGYARTSTADQIAGLEAQIRDLKAAGCEKVYSEHASAVTRERPQLVAALEFARAGDVIMVTKPDRLARNTVELLGMAEELTKRGIGLVVLSLGGERVDFSKPTSKLILTILAGVASWEREIMKERQAEGIAKAKGEGKYKGRKPTAQAKGAEVLKLAADGVGPVEIAKRLNIGRTSVHRILTAKKAA